MSRAGEAFLCPSLPFQNVKSSQSVIVLGEPFFGKIFWKIGVSTSGLKSIKWWHHQVCLINIAFIPFIFAFIPSNQKAVFVGSNLRRSQTSWIFIKNPLVMSSLFVMLSLSIFILLDCFMQLLQIQRLTKYNQLHFHLFIISETQTTD